MSTPNIIHNIAGLEIISWPCKTEFHQNFPVFQLNSMQFCSNNE